MGSDHDLVGLYDDNLYMKLNLHLERWKAAAKNYFHLEWKVVLLVNIKASQGYRKRLKAK